MWGARRRKVRTNLSRRLHIHLNYLLSNRNSNNKTKQKTNPLTPKLQPLVMTKWNFPLEITSLRNDITLHQHLQISTRDTDQLSSETHDTLPLHHLKPKLLHFPSRLLELAQMTHMPHLVLSFSTSACLSGFPKQVQEQSCGNLEKQCRQALEEKGMKRHYSTSLLYFEDKTNTQSLLYIQKR